MSGPMSGPVIGVFDSGFGGLTVLRALVDEVPWAQFVFLGDTARLPYGSKSQRTIARYATESARFLVERQGAEHLVIACNTASALALGAIREAVAVPVIGVIEPGAEAAAAATRTGTVMVMATEATVASHAYSEACQRRGLRGVEKACPLLVPLVEEGWIEHAVTEQVVRIYLDEMLAESAAAGLRPDTLVLGCTHYPLLRPVLERVVPTGVAVIDSAEATAARVAEAMARRRNWDGRMDSPANGVPAADGAARIRCFATDSVAKFERLGSRFLGQPVGAVELVDLGG